MPQGKKKSSSRNRTTSKRAGNSRARAQLAMEQPTDGMSQVSTQKRSRQTQNQEVCKNTDHDVCGLAVALGKIYDHIPSTHRLGIPIETL